MVGTRMAIRLRPRSKGKLSWAGWTVAPWCLATGLLVSFVADAGQDPTIGATRLTLTGTALGMPAVLIPAATANLGGGADFRVPLGDGIIREARLLVGDTQEIEKPADEIEPKAVLKSRAKDRPSIDRTNKGNPGVGLRPTFEARLRQKGTLPAYLKSAMAFDAGDPGAPPHELLPPTSETPGPESVDHFEPVPEGITITTAPSRAGTSPGGGGASVTTSQSQDGSTPVVTRAVALASATPVETESTPVQIAPLPKFSRGSNGQIASGTTVVMGIVGETQPFSALPDQAQSTAERYCLAQAIYFEARSEPEEGQAAVAQVVLNRVMSGLYPQTICGVVFQNHQRRNACQFSFACEGHALRITESAPWGQAVRVANEVLDGAAYVSDVGGSTHYHANYVAPVWARRLVKMDRIGNHIFYKLRPGQT